MDKRSPGWHRPWENELFGHSSAGYPTLICLLVIHFYFLYMRVLLIHFACL